MPRKTETSRQFLYETTWHFSKFHLMNSVLRKTSNYFKLSHRLNRFAKSLKLLRKTLKTFVSKLLANRFDLSNNFEMFHSVNSLLRKIKSFLLPDSVFEIT